MNVVIQTKGTKILFNTHSIFKDSPEGNKNGNYFTDCPTWATMLDLKGTCMLQFKNIFSSIAQYYSAMNLKPQDKGCNQSKQKFTNQDIKELLGF